MQGPITYMFENRTLVDLLRFKWTVQAWTEVLSGIPTSLLGLHPLEPVNTNTCSMDVPQAHLRALARTQVRWLEVRISEAETWKSSIEPSFSSLKDLEETWSSIRRGLGLCSISCKKNQWIICIALFLSSDHHSKSQTHYLEQSW